MVTLDQNSTEYISRLTSPQKEVCTELRRMITNYFPEWEEKFKWGYPCYYYNGKGICSLAAFKHHSNLVFEYGAQLNDPKKMFEGTGKNMRHIKIQKVSEINNAYLLKLLEESQGFIRNS